MSAERLRLRVLHTNDLHSHFEQMPKVAAIIRQLRAEAGEEHTITLDIGDHMDRMHPETEGTKGMANIAVLEATGYDAVTLGNNEGLTFTRELLAEIYTPAPFEVVASNLPESGTGLVPPWATTRAIVNKAGIRVGLIGVTAYYTDYYNLLGWDIQEPLQVTASLVSELRDQVDVLIVMSHLGLRLDERMAEEIAGIDLILGGHTHHLLEKPKRIQNTLVCGTGKFGQYVGLVDVELDPQTGTIISAAGGVVDAAHASESDPAVEQVIAKYTAAAEQVLSRVVVQLGEHLPVSWYSDSPLGNLLAAGLRKVTQAEIGLVNAGQLLNGLERGSVTAGDLLSLCPSPINPCRMLLTGEQLRQALEESLQLDYMNKPIVGFGFRGKTLGTLCLDGMTAEYDPEGANGSKLRSVLIGGEPLSLTKYYRVGTIDMFTFGIGYLSISRGIEVEYLLPEFIRDVLLAQLRSPEALADCKLKRWSPLY